MLSQSQEQRTLQSLEHATFSFLFPRPLPHINMSINSHASLRNKIHVLNRQTHTRTATHKETLHSNTYIKTHT